jgi:hypothetical protein
LVGSVGRCSAGPTEHRALAYEFGKLVAEFSNERRFGLAFLQQRQRAVVVPEAASTQFTDRPGRGAGLGINSSLAWQFTQLGELVGGEQGQLLVTRAPARETWRRSAAFRLA